MTQEPMLRANVYVDGFNFYYGALRHRPHLKWLDYRALAEELLSGYEVYRVRYFTAPAQNRLNDKTVSQRQGVYLQALEENSAIEIYKGQFKESPARLPLASELKKGKLKFVEVMRTVEKGSDASLSAYLVRDSCHKEMDVALVMSNDSDLQTPVDIAEQEGITVITVNPHEQRNQQRVLRSSDKRTLDEGILRRSQLPDPVLSGSGREIYKPRPWS